MPLPLPPPGASLGDVSSVNRFLTEVSRNGSLSNINRFVVQIFPPTGLGAADTTDLIYMCESTTMPGRAKNITQIRYYGPSFQVPYQTLYEDVICTFLVKSTYEERFFFDEWMHYINPVNNYDFTYYDDYVGSVAIYQLDQRNRITYSFMLENAYPVAIAGQPVNWTDPEFQRVAVTFTYKQWTRGGLDANVGGAIAF